MTPTALKAQSPAMADRYRPGDGHPPLAHQGVSRSASWDEARQAVRFTPPCGALGAAITREALEMLAGCHLPSSAEALREFRRHRSWIEGLASFMMEERCERAVVLTQSDIRFQMAYEAEMLVQAVRV